MFLPTLHFTCICRDVAKDIQQVELIFVHHRREILFKKKEKELSRVFQAEKIKKTQAGCYFFRLPPIIYIPDMQSDSWLVLLGQGHVKFFVRRK